MLPSTLKGALEGRGIFVQPQWFWAGKKTVLKLIHTHDYDIIEWSLYIQTKWRLMASLLLEIQYRVKRV